MKRSTSHGRGKILFIINVDWYFLLHWMDRARAAKRAGYEIHIASSINSPVRLQKMQDAGFEVHDIPFSRSSMNVFTELSCLRKTQALIDVIQPDLLHCITLKPIVYAGAISRRRSIPTLFSVTGLGYTYSAYSIKYRLVWWALQKALKYAFNSNRSLVAFENSHDLQLLSSRGVLSPYNAVVLPGAGVDLERFSPTEEVRGTRLQVLFAARLLLSKGLDLLVDAVRQLRSMGHVIDLHVAGISDKESHDSIPESLLQRWVDNQDIIWHGKVEDIETLIAQSNIVCLPTSYGEGIPRILIEAAAVGRAVITTDMPGCRDFVVNKIDGVLVSPGDLNELVEAIATLAEDDQWRYQLAEAARQKVQGIYNNDSVIRKTLDLYAALMSDSPLPTHTLSTDRRG